MHRLPTLAVLLVFVAGIAGSLVLWRRAETAQGAGFLVYDREGTACLVVIPDRATAGEHEAAKLLADTLAAAAGVDQSRFPIVSEAEWTPGRRALFVGATEHAAKLYRLAGESALERPVAWTVTPDGVIVRARWREDAVAAASLFLEQAAGARWFVPGDLGLEVAQHKALRLPLGDHVSRPSYLSRDLGGLTLPDEVDWYRANRLAALFEHGHTAAHLFPADVQAREPGLAPWWDGGRRPPRVEEVGNWQPDYTAPAAAARAAELARAAFRAQPGRLSFAVGQNDNYRYDQSAATLAAIAPERYFRGKPDYSGLVFGFLNRVAADVGRDYPDRFLTTYAYDWTQDAPAFRLETGILPYLAADRSQWFDPAFAAGDLELIRRWHDVGPRMLGLYDYYYGAPYFIPRPTLYAVTGPIPGAYELGARAFFAECFPNWGLDGPKLWLAAQLLWDARQDPAALVDEYFKRFWRDAAPAMRDYFAICDRQWRTQPQPGYWNKYYKDDQQCLLFPPAVREEMRACLERAERSTFEPVVHRRLLLMEAAFSLMDEFCRHQELREELERAALDPESGATVLVGAWNRYSTARDRLRRLQQETQRTFPLAVKSELLGEYLRHDPRRRVVWDLGQRGFDPGLLNEPGLRSLFSGRRISPSELRASTAEVAQDPDFATLSRREGHPFTLVEWAAPGTPWVARGEPCENRAITLGPAAGGGQAVRYAGCSQESLFQWLPSQPAALYLASVRVQAKVSPGNMTFLILTFLDRDGRYLGSGHIDRLPVGAWGKGTELKVLVRAPRAAAQIGVGVRTLGQVNDDFVEYERLSLKRIE